MSMGLYWMNTIFGYGPADAALVEVASMLDAVGRAHDGTTFRIGGDEFLVVMPVPSSESAALAMAKDGIRAVRSLGIGYQRDDLPAGSVLVVNAVVGPVTSALTNRIKEAREWLAREVLRAKDGNVQRREVIANVTNSVAAWEM